MCKLGEGGWSDLYKKCKLQEIPMINQIVGDRAIGNFCDGTHADEQEEEAVYGKDNMMCFAENYHMCHWGNVDTDGINDGGWSDLYNKCELWNLDTNNV
jgi:hypothetical protein